MKKLISAALAATMLASFSTVLTAAETLPTAIVFTEESGYRANTYTGFIEGLRLDTTAEDIISSLENSNNTALFKGDAAISGDERVSTGCVLRLSDDSGRTLSELTAVVLGDLNGDAAVSVADAVAVLKIAAGWDTDYVRAAGDVNANGDVDVSDAIAILKYAAGWKDAKLADTPVYQGKYTAKSFNYLRSFTAVEQNSLNLRRGDIVGVKFSVADDERAESINAVYPSWANNIGEITVCIYRWAGDYATTVAATPIYTETYVDFPDCANLEFSLKDSAGHGLAAGDYLWTITGRESSGGVGMWKNGLPSEDSGIEMFFNGDAADFGVEATLKFSCLK